MSARAHLMRGNLSKKSLAELEDEVQLLVETPDCPKHLWPEAKKEWKRIGPELEDAGLVAKIDRSALALYCQSWARWVWHEECLARDIEICRKKREAFEAQEAELEKAAAGRGETYAVKEWAGGDGFMIPTPNGSFTYSPHWVGAKTAADQVDKFLQSFGMSPSSRVRVRQSNNYWLPGMDPKDGAEAAASTQGKVTSLADFKKPH